MDRAAVLGRVGRVRVSAAIALSKKHFLKDHVLYRNQFFQRVLSTSPREYHLLDQNFCIAAML